MHHCLISAYLQSANIHFWPSEAKWSILESLHHAVDPGDKVGDVGDNMRIRVIVALVLDRKRDYTQELVVVADERSAGVPLQQE